MALRFDGEDEVDRVAGYGKVLISRWTILMALVVGMIFGIEALVNWLLGHSLSRHDAIEFFAVIMLLSIVSLIGEGLIEPLYKEFSLRTKEIDGKLNEVIEKLGEIEERIGRIEPGP
jgi:hypothetical protein